MLGLGNSLTSYFVSSGEDFGTNHSLSFDGSNDEVDFTTAGFQEKLSASQGNFKVSGSVSVWARLNTTGSNGQLWDFYINDNNRINIQYKHNVTHKYVFTWRGSGAQKTADSATGLTHEGDGNFHHIVCTWDKGSANEMKLYIDGSLIRTVSLGTVELTGDFNDTADGTIGQDGSGGVEFLSGTSFNGNADFNGFLDDFAVYSDVLTVEDVETLYNSGTSDQTNVGTVGTIVAHWTFNEGTGSIVTDRIGGFVGTFGGSGKNPTFSTANAGA
jgi:hypothetical protein